MNWDRIAGNWKLLKGNVTQQWGMFSDDEFDVLHGKHEQVAGKILKSYAINRDEANKQLGAWLARQELMPQKRH
ncbi:MAG: CsbD family protein [Sideroxydans sp.]|nr:CsbD family protein [Sideroxydans sp.]